MDIFEASNWVRRELREVGEGFSVMAGEKHAALNVRKVEDGEVRELDFVPQAFRIDISFDCRKTGVRLHVFGEADEPVEAARAAVANGKAAQERVASMGEP